MNSSVRPRAMLVMMFAALACNAACVDPTPDRIVLVVIDTLRADHVFPQVEDSETPHFQALAAGGQVFSSAYGSYHQTTMSMAALFTGHVPSLEVGQNGKALKWNGKTWCGMRRFASPGAQDACIPAHLPSLASRLRDAGYWSVGVSTNSLLFTPLGYERGFDEWIEVGRPAGPASKIGQPGSHAVARSAAKANALLEVILDQRPTDRFFLYMHYMEAHDYLAARIPYQRGVGRSDQAIGRLLEILKERDLLEGTTIFLVSDHGERLKEDHFIRGGPLHYGNPSFEEVLRVPLIVSPALEGRDTDALVRSDDIHRMILETGGVETSPSTELDPGEIFVSEERYQTYRKGRFKSFRRRGQSQIALVDLEVDPAETQDVAAQHPEVVANHRARMQALTDALRAEVDSSSGLSAEDRRRLEALGYLDPEQGSGEARR